MKKNFYTGIMTGLCGALLIFSILGAVYLFMDTKTDGYNQDDRFESINDETDDTNEANSEYTKIIEKLEFLELLIDKYYLEEVDQNLFADAIYKGFMKSLKDPYSTYYTQEEYKALMESSSGVYHGIGTTVSQNAKTGIITIVKPFESSPAHEAGLLPGDILYKVEDEEVTGVDLSEVVSRMKGKEGTSVNITVIRENVSEPIELNIVRREIKVPTVEYKMLDDKIGLITILEFDEVTVNQFDRAVTELEKAGMQGLVVDVRNNPGGLLSGVVKMLDRLLPEGLLVYTEDKYGNRLEEPAKNPDQINVPLAVLINGNSASASEIFAGAIQDYEKGTIVGTTSFGKGIVQKVIPLSDGTAVKLTISKYFTPKGRNIHGTGIEPDIKVELKDELKQMTTIPVEEDNQLQEALRVIKEKIYK